MTYNQQIEVLRQLVDMNYELAGALRDTAIGKEKDIFNQMREKCGAMSLGLQQLQNSLSPGRAKMEKGEGVETYIRKRIENILEN